LIATAVSAITVTAAYANDINKRWQPAVEHAQEGSNAVSIETVSTRNDMVSGGDVLVRIKATGDVDLGTVNILVGDRLVTADFRSDAEGLLGIVSGLEIGENQLHVDISEGSRASLAVTNHQITGPLFGGPQQMPFVCETDGFIGLGLGAPIDEKCSIETRVDYFYRSGGEFKPLPDTSTLPDDVEMTTIRGGGEVPYVVRVETGTINRSIYNIAILHDPTSDAEPGPFTAEPGWNKKIVYFFGGGCIRGYYRQGEGELADVMQDGWLREGYAAIQSSLNVAGNNCNTMISAEATTMIKEHFVETYGDPIFTIGTGSSGGAYQTQAIVNSYPGVLDGIIIGSVFADVTTSTLFTLGDARLLYHYFNETHDPNTFAPWQQRAISGFGSEGNIEFLGTTGGAMRMNPTESFLDAVPTEVRYDPTTNPSGARSTVYDHTVNVYGKDADGKAYRPLDNVGVQYGLEALNDAVIDKSMFIDLNEKIGGFDLDLNYVPGRTEANPEAIRAAHRTGLIMDAGPNYAAVPVIDFRNYRDARRNGDIHHLVHGFASRARLQAANPDSYNHVMWFGGRNTYAPDGQLTEAFTVMDNWLSAMAADGSDTMPYDKVRANKPDDLADACFVPASGERIVQTQVYLGTNECSSLYYPAFSSPRQVAGSPMANDIVKCQLKPLDSGDYNVTFTSDELSKLEQIFPTGVCDWTKPGVEQVASEPWLRWVD
jgi:hypothetical protein